MHDLISRSALIEKMSDTNIEITFDLPVEELLGEDVDMDDFCTLLQDAIQAYRKLVIGEVINKAPTVDAVPVVHGEWKKYKISNLFSHTCNVCECDVNKKTPYCPWCGAKMDGESVRNHIENIGGILQAAGLTDEEIIAHFFGEETEREKRKKEEGQV